MVMQLLMPLKCSSQKKKEKVTKNNNYIQKHTQFLWLSLMACLCCFLVSIVPLSLFLTNELSSGINLFFTLFDFFTKSGSLIILFRLPNPFFELPRGLARDALNKSFKAASVTFATLLLGGGTGFVFGICFPNESKNRIDVTLLIASSYPAD